MRKTFCDFCSNEITDSNSDRLLGKKVAAGRLGEHVAAIMDHAVFAIDGVDCCKFCIIDTLNMHDDRPRQADHVGEGER